MADLSCCGHYGHDSGDHPNSVIYGHHNGVNTMAIIAVSKARISVLMARIAVLMAVIPSDLNY